MSLSRICHALTCAAFAAFLGGPLSLWSGGAGAADPSTSQQAGVGNPGPEEAKSIAAEAWIHLYPMVQNYQTIYQFALNPQGPQYKGPMNEIHNVGRVFTYRDTTIVTANSDTPYSYLMLDLRREPIVVTLPPIESGRYYSLQIADLYTHNVDYLGTRKDGNNGGRFLIAGPAWDGQVPPGITRAVRVPTQLAFAQFRTQLFGNDDLERVKAIQAKYKAQPLSAYLNRPPPPAAPGIDYPAISQELMEPKFWAYANFLLQFCPPLPGEEQLRQRFARIGVKPAGPWPPEGLSPQLVAAVDDGARAAREALVTDALKLTTSVGLFGTPQVMQGKYRERALGALAGIYGNDVEETIYPAYQTDAQGRQLDSGKNNYTLTFKPGQLPPVNAFWSVTMYDGRTKLMIKNPLERYLINSAMLPALKKNADGGITLYLQHDSPGPQLESNWLPAPDGPMGMTMRLYLPKPEVVGGQWTAPPVQAAARPAPAHSPPAPGNARAAAPSGTPIPVTPDNFARAESDLYFSGVVKNGGFGKFDHTREPAPLDKQTIIRLNRDTLYSAAIFDLDAGPVTITLPNAGTRFMSLQIIDEDQYTHGVHYKAGNYTLTRQGIGTRYVVAAVRILVDPANAADVRAVHALQDAIKVAQKRAGAFEIPNWDQASQKKVRDALLVLASTLPDTNRMYGRRDEVDPVRFVIGAAQGWGANPAREALYLNIVPPRNDGATVYRLDVRDVPVDGFWSITVYNAQGYFEPNPFNAYSVNNVTAKKEKDGSVRVQFGGCSDQIPNCLPTMKGWNYMVRLYRPRPEVLNGKWKFAEAQPVD